MTDLRDHDPHEIPDDLLRRLYDLSRRAELAGREHAPFWGLAEFTGAVRTPVGHETRDLLLAYSDDTPGATLVGSGVMFRELTANLDKARLMVTVDPTAQRRGVGRALAQALEARATADDRTVLLAGVAVPADDPLGSPRVAFARALGYDVAQVEMSRHLSLPVDEARLDALLQSADPAAGGYTLETLVDDIPVDLREPLARLHAQLFVDAPSGGVDYEEGPANADHITERLAAVRAMGRLVYETVALTVAPTGRRQVVAQSTLAVPTDPAGTGDAYQWGTFVDRGHRGHRLGLAVKAANLRAVQRDRPGLSRVITQNAETNARMVAINEELGFVAAGAVVDLVKRTG